jgi:phage gp29-like protein
VQGALTALCNAEISKLISGATLTSETGGPGSFALGAVHQNTRFKLIQGDANRLKSSFVRDVAIPFLHYNSFSEGTRPPWLKNHIVRETMPEERAKVMALVKNDLGTRGVRIEASASRTSSNPAKKTGARKSARGVVGRLWRRFNSGLNLVCGCTIYAYRYNITR